MDFYQSESREAYEKAQLQASTAKLGYCKFSFADAERYIDAIRRDKRARGDSDSLGSVICLGVRNGREVDCFRIAKHGSLLRRSLVSAFEYRHHGFAARLGILESWGRSTRMTVDENDCIGVELNPLASRSDIWVGSFDQLPAAWTDRFEIAYTNAFDHAYDPEAAAACWRRVVKRGGYLVLAFPTEQAAAPLDPIGKVSMDDVSRLFPGELIYYRLKGSEWGYTEYIVKLA